MNFYSSFLIKYGEIGLKGKNRFIFENKLIKNIKHSLYNLGYSFNVRKEQGRIYIDMNGDYDFNIFTKRLSEVFGIVGICPMVMSSKKDIEEIGRLAVEVLKNKYNNEKFTFKCVSRRADKKYPLNSMEINREIGGIILDNMENSKVEVHNPDCFLEIEVRENIYIYADIIKGAGGMPVGSAGKAMLLLSGGIDSPVAGYMIGKRGVEIDAVYFHAPPYTSERAKGKVIELAKIVSKYTGKINLHIVNFTDIQMSIYELCPHDELTIIMRRYMMKIAEYFGVKNGCLGLITGESIGQVASQTMGSLMCTNEVCTLPVYRPLIAMDKVDIIEISEKIGAYETSILPYEDCCTIFVAKHPVTKPSLNIIKRHEENLKDVIEKLMDEALDTVEIIEIEE